MRNRQMTPSGDTTIFSGATQFLVNSPAAVAQAVLTRLNLWQGQWFLDSTLGLPVYQQILGFGTQAVRDAAIQNVILNTPGVNQITQYTSSLVNRAFRVQATIDTIYGSTTITTSF